MSYDRSQKNTKSALKRVVVSWEQVTERRGDPERRAGEVRVCSVEDLECHVIEVLWVNGTSVNISMQDNCSWTGKMANSSEHFLLLQRTQVQLPAHTSIGSQPPNSSLKVIWWSLLASMDTCMHEMHMNSLRHRHICINKYFSDNYIPSELALCFMETTVMAVYTGYLKMGKAD